MWGALVIIHMICPTLVTTLKYDRILIFFGLVLFIVSTSVILFRSLKTSKFHEQNKQHGLFVQNRFSFVYRFNFSYGLD